MKPELVEIAQNAAGALGPAALGSAVAQAWKPGLSWRQRLAQWLVGICVSYFVTRAASVTFGLNEFVAQAIGFVVAMCAFEVAPRLVKGIGDACAAIPDIVRDFAGRFRAPGG
jgi:hypothetical protein